MEAYILSIIQLMVAKYPMAITILSVIGFCRLIFKPTFAFLRVIVDATTWTNKDNEFLDKVVNSKVYSWVAFALDWFASVKLPTPAPTDKK